MLAEEDRLAVEARMAEEEPPLSGAEEEEEDAEEDEEEVAEEEEEDNAHMNGERDDLPELGDEVIWNVEEDDDIVDLESLLYYLEAGDADSDSSREPNNSSEEREEVGGNAEGEEPQDDRHSACSGDFS